LFAQERVERKEEEEESDACSQLKRSRRQHQLRSGDGSFSPSSSFSKAYAKNLFYDPASVVPRGRGRVGSGGGLDQHRPRGQQGDIVVGSSSGIDGGAGEEARTVHSCSNRASSSLSLDRPRVAATATVTTAAAATLVMATSTFVRTFEAVARQTEEATTTTIVAAAAADRIPTAVKRDDAAAAGTRTAARPADATPGAAANPGAVVAPAEMATSTTTTTSTSAGTVHAPPPLPPSLPLTSPFKQDAPQVQSWRHSSAFSSAALRHVSLRPPPHHHCRHHRRPGPLGPLSFYL